MINLKVGDKVFFDCGFFYGQGLVVEIDGITNNIFIELPKEYHGLGHNGYGYTKFTYNKNNYYYITQDNIHCVIRGNKRAV